MSAFLEGISGEYAGQRIPINQYHLTIGRGTGNQLLLHDPHVSRNHSLIRYSNGYYGVEDQNSRMGTRVNGTPVRSSKLQEGDIIDIGGNSFRFSIGGRSNSTKRNNFGSGIPMKNYTTDAILVLVLYYIGLWVVGFVFNIIRLSEANHFKQDTGEEPEGLGCLWALLIFHIAVPILILLAILATGGAILTWIGLGSLSN